MEFKAEVESLLEGYFAWLKQNTKIDEFNGGVELTTPHLDRHNDCLQLVLKRTKDGYQLSDGGYILADLEDCGCSMSSPKRKALLREILNGFGVSHDGDELVVQASAEDFAIKKHSLIQAMLAVNDLFFTSTRNVLAGRSDYTHKFDFVIPAFRGAPERVLKSINNPNKQNALKFIASWQDVQTERKSAQAIAILNDADRRVSRGVVDALHKYEIKTLPWSDRAEHIKELAA